MQVCLISICVFELVAGDFFYFFFIMPGQTTLSTLEDEGMLFATSLNLTDKTHSNTQDEAKMLRLLTQSTLHRYKHYMYRTPSRCGCIELNIKTLQPNSAKLLYSQLYLSPSQT